MARVIRYLSHPQVVIDPDAEVTSWSLSAIGRKRVERVLGAEALKATQTVISSAERKAIETGRPIAEALGCAFVIREWMHENDRSATGFLPPPEFEAVADQFFADPDVSVRGWETARAAQARIVGEVTAALRAQTKGDVLFVGHGGVGTLLYCHLAAVPISRDYDQGPGGGGCFFAYQEDRPDAVTHWRPMEELT